jgi:hypothetical protein
MRRGSPGACLFWLAQIWGEEALQFQEKLLNSSGLGDETYFPDSACMLPSSAPLRPATEAACCWPACTMHLLHMLLLTMHSSCKPLHACRSFTGIVQQGGQLTGMCAA